MSMAERSRFAILKAGNFIKKKKEILRLNKIKNYRSPPDEQKSVGILSRFAAIVQSSPSSPFSPFPRRPLRLYLATSVFLSVPGKRLVAQLSQK